MLVRIDHIFTSPKGVIASQTVTNYGDFIKGKKTLDQATFV
jgi:hypothetical protein